MMEMIGAVVLLLVILFVMYKLGLFSPVVELTAVARRESAVYNRGHKAAVAKRYESMAVDVDVVKVNENIAKIDALAFD
jgi:hypothetical protein